MLETIGSFIPEAFIIIGLLLMLLELIIGIEAGFDLVLIGSILMISGFLGIVTGNFTLLLAVSIVLSAIYILYGRAKIKSKLIVKTTQTNVDNLIGKTGLTLNPIAPHKSGIVKIGDEDWRATSTETITANHEVEVTGIEGVTVIVKPKVNK